MQDPRLPKTQDIVLVGGGHTHALVLRMWGMKPVHGVRLTVINPGPTAPYSGMLPGFVAGHYDRDALDIDLMKLARFAGARVVAGNAEGIDTNRREVHVPGRPPIAYDVASVNVGITSDMPTTAGFAEHAVPAKPLGPFSRQWADYLEETGPARVAVIGGGVAGAELIMAMAFALHQKDRPAKLTLIDAETALSALAPRARQVVLRQLADLGVSVIENAPVARVNADSIELSDGTIVEADFTTGAAGARPYDWVANSGLEMTDGFITVGPTLQSSDPAVFAAGDCAHLSHAPRPKAGVYAVREAPVLLHNLRALATGGSMKSYTPQNDYLKLVSLGGKSALAEKWGVPFSGGLMWRWKDHIDRTFMDRFRDLPSMNALPDLPAVRTRDMEAALGDKPMCGGCGAKVGRTALRGVLEHIPPSDRDDLTPLPGDDAALLRVGEQRQVLTSDHLRAFTEDPVTMTRIAAVHALGDIWAMGGTPQAATANLILPRLSPALQRRTLAEIMSAATEVMHAAGAEIVGGHTSVGDELTIGFSITGLCKTDPITLSGAKSGDRLILTKPIGTGVLMAAEMAGQARGEWVVAALNSMTRPQSDAARLLELARAMTDVTGFGLAGHLLGMAEASGLTAVLDLARVPSLPGAVELANSGVRSSLFPENHAITPDLPEDGLADLLFDPQTAGGLLAAVPADKASDCLDALKAAGYQAADIGWFEEGAPQVTLSD